MSKQLIHSPLPNRDNSAIGTVKQFTLVIMWPEKLNDIQK